MNIIFVLSIFSFCSALYSKGLKVEISPYTFLSSGKYEVTGSAVDKGSYSGFGVGSKAGLSTERLWIGLDASIVKPSFKSDSSESDAFSNPLLDGQSLVSYGAGFSLKLIESLNIGFTYFLNQEISGNTSNGTSTAKYTYYGQGWKAGIVYKMAEGLNLLAFKDYTKFDQFKVSRDIGSFSSNGKQNRSDFTMEGFSIGIELKLKFGSLGSGAL
jgi:hemolysin activation/secretion protein